MSPITTTQLTLAATEFNAPKLISIRGSMPQASNDQIGEFLRQHRPYLKQGYRLTHMSRELGIPRHILSRMINEQYGMNFNALINLFRVEYLKELPNLDPHWQLYTMEALGRLAGFHCRNTLTKAFQKCTGESPSRYFLRISQQPAGDETQISFSRPGMDMVN